MAQEKGWFCSESGALEYADWYGPYGSMDEAVGEGRERFGSLLSFHVVHVTRKAENIDFSLFDSDELLERFEQRNDDQGGEDGWMLDVPKAVASDLENQLTAAMRKWWIDNQHRIKRFWTFDKVLERHLIPALEGVET